MCAIAGILSYGTHRPVDTDELLRIREHMVSRGPDGSGLWLSPGRRLGFAHRRLAIIDLSEAGAQPMSSEDGRFVVTFNGEIYNYAALRDELVLQGQTFKTRSDTEVLLHLYRRDGQAMLERLRGMFALAIWDEEKQELFLARDRFGIKPLYWSNSGGAFRFASQVTALVAGGGLSEEPDPAGWVSFFLFGWVLEPFTTYKDIRSLPAACWMIVRSDGSSSTGTYYSIATALSQKVGGGSVDASTLSSAVVDSVSQHLVSDVPVGCFLSAGIDSGTLLSHMRSLQGSNVHAVTLAFAEFEESENDEAPLASIVAKQLGVRHSVVKLSRNEFVASLSHLLGSMDQPSVDGVNTYFVSQAAAKVGLKVVLSGLGGDELFAGYSSYNRVPRIRALNKLLPLPSGMRAASRGVMEVLLSPLRLKTRKFSSLLEYGSSWEGAYMLYRGLFMPWELSSVLEPSFVKRGLGELLNWKASASFLSPEPDTTFGCVAALELQGYTRNQLLRDSDWASMAHSLELRVPLIDHQLFATVASGKGVFRKKDLAQTAPTALPAEVIDRPKTGFSIPTGRWIQDEMGPGALGESRGADSRTWARTVARRWPAGNRPPMVG